VRYVRENRSRTDVNLQITTNGTVWKPDLVTFLKRNRVGIAISIDGPPGIMNAARPPADPKLDVYEKATTLLKECQRARLDYSVLCTVTKHNADRIGEVARFLTEKLGVERVSFNLQLRKPNRETEDQLLWWQRLGRNMAAAYRFMAESENAVLDGRTLRYISGLTEGTYSVSECDAGYGSQIVVKPDGSIGPCQGFLFNKESFKKLDDWRSAQTRPEWTRFVHATPANIATCLDCPFVGTCGGGCHYNRESFTEPNRNFCAYMHSLLFTIIGFLLEQEKAR
jgi:uncharacterized protein